MKKVTGKSITILKNSNLGWLIIVFAVFLLLLSITPAFADSFYRDFEELSLNEVEREDYTISYMDTKSEIAIIAIHGGEIQPGTTEIAAAIAGVNTEQQWFDFYSFNGIKKINNSSLFIKAINFDEPNAEEMVAKSKSTLSIIGASGEDCVIYIGGRDSRKILLKPLLEVWGNIAGFEVKDAPLHMAGEHETNICNLNSVGSGIQIAISYGLREELLNNHGKLEEFVNIIKTLI